MIEHLIDNLQITLKALKKDLKKVKSLLLQFPYFIIIIILPIEKHMQSKTMVLYPPCY